MKKFFFLTVCYFEIISGNFARSEILLASECKPNESCIRLCCASNSLNSECPDLSSMPENKKFRSEFKILKGRPCEEMFIEEEPWEFLAVSFTTTLVIYN